MIGLRFLVDTNVLSLLDRRRAPYRGFMGDWFKRYTHGLSIPAIAVMEMENGLLKLRREGKLERARELAALAAEIETSFAGRVLPVDAEVARAMARLGHVARPTVVAWADLAIAATARVHGLTVLTRNIRHFEPTGVPVVDPVTTPPWQ